MADYRSDIIVPRGEVALRAKSAIRVKSKTIAAIF
jgi:hypothetical protein